MSEQSRHRPPTVEMLFNRVYRQHLALQKIVKEVRTQVEQLAASHQVHAVVASHCQRLLLEKKTLLQLVEADRYMAQALPRRNPPTLTEIAS